MRNPHIMEAMGMFEHMTRIHKEELYRSTLFWKEIKNGNGNVVQLVPVADLLFKF